MQKRINVILILLASLIGIILYGCSNDSKLDIAKSVYENMFLAINSDEYTEYENWVNGDADVPKWIYDRFGENMSDDCLQRLISDELYKIQIYSYNKSRQIETKNIKVKKSDNCYELSGYITLKKHDNIIDYVTATDIKVSGELVIDDNNKIIDINISNKDEILNKIEYLQ